MKDFKAQLFSIQETQNKLMEDYQVLINEYESHDLIRENQVLLREYEEYKRRLAELQTKYAQSEEENAKLRTSLAEQMMDEKLNLLKVSRNKLNAYFGAKSQSHMNRLTSLEYETKASVDRLFRLASSQLQEDKVHFIERLNQISTELNQSIVQHRERLAEEERKLLSETSERFDSMAEEDIDEETIQKRIKQNQFEMKIGLNWINKLGMLLIILGVGAAFRYSYSTWFNGYMKGSAFFLLGALLIVGGEWFFRKQKQTFALGLLGGGISVLYGSIFYSYFLLEIIGLTAGLALSVLVSVIAVFLSLRYRSRTICSLGLVGGYLPFFSYMGVYGLEGNAVYAAMIYLFLLNLFILFISFRQRWVIVNYISFLFNTPSMLALVSISDSPLYGMVYSIVTFGMYLGMTLSYPFKYQSKLSWWDFALLALNTAVSCGVLYDLFDEAGLDDYNGLLALIFCLVYIGLGRFVEKAMKQEKQTILLFYATSLTFAVLMIPFQFGVQWLSMGWLVEGILLIVYGSLNRFKALERTGWGIFLLCLGAFFLYDLALSKILMEYSTHHFDIKYSSVTAGTLLVIFYYSLRWKDKPATVFYSASEASLLSLFKYCALVNLWFYLLYESNHLYQLWVPRSFSHFEFYTGLLIASVTIGLAYTLTKVTVLYDRVVKVYCVILYGIGCLTSLLVTLTEPALSEPIADNSAVSYISLGLLIGYNLFVFFIGRDFLIAVIRRQFKSIELYPLLAGVYLLGILTAFLSVQFRLGDISLAFSLLYLLLSIAFIMYGFSKKYVYIRRLGLGLSLLSTGKLFLYDLSLLTTGSKIVAYFCFGLVLLGISFIYQKLSNRQGNPDVQIKADSKN